MSFFDFDVLLRSGLAVISALIGVVTTFSLKLNHEKLCSLISFSAGALLGAALFSILPETYGELSFWEIAVGAVSGYLLFWVISKYFSHVCPACSASHFDEQTTKKFSDIVTMMIIALAFHSFFDGIALVSHGEHSHFDENSIFFAVLIHKFPEGLALASLMLGAAYSKRNILIKVLLVESTTILGAIAGSLMVSYEFPVHIMNILMAHIAGGFIFLGIHAIQGEMLKNHKKLVWLSFVFGMMLILSTHFFGEYLL